MLPADEHDSGVAAHHAVGQFPFPSLRERGGDRQPQALTQTLNGLIRPMRGCLAGMPPGGRDQDRRRPQAGALRTAFRMKQDSEGAGALPSARQQRMLVVAALKVNAGQRRLQRLLRVPDDVDDVGRHVHAVNVKHHARPDRTTRPGRIRSFLNIRVKDIRAVYAEESG
jgi:hypothetical protein